MLVMPRSSSSSLVLAFMARRSTSRPRRGSRPRNTFSATVRSGSRLNSWNTVDSPATCAWVGWWNSTGVPPIATVPASRSCTPASTFIRVDLPAPFSPTSPCTSPACSRRSTSSSTGTPKKDFDRPVTSSTGELVRSFMRSL